MTEIKVELNSRAENMNKKTECLQLLIAWYYIFKHVHAVNKSLPVPANVNTLT